MLVGVALRISTVSTSAQEANVVAESGNVCKTDNADIMMVIDTSNSMAGGNLQAAKSAAVDLVNIVSKNPKMRIGVASFDNHGRVNQQLNSTASTVISSINAMQTGGNNGTCLECALRQKGNNDVFNAFANAGANGNKRHVIILTDGKINRYQKPDGSVEGKAGDKQEEKKARDQALGAIADISQNQGVAFWIVQYGTQENKAWLDSIVATYNGKGKYFFAPSLANVDEIYKAIANELSGGKLTAFVFDDVNKNGKFDADENEKPLKDVEVTMTDANGSKTQKTGDDGKTTFAQLCGTAYKLKVNPPDTYQPSPPDSNEKDVTVELGKEKTEDFGMTKGEITFNFQFVLHGLGIAGDQVALRPPACKDRAASASNNATTGTSTNGCFSNQNPLHPTRDVVIEMLNASGSAVASLSSTMTYASESGFFKGVGKITTGVKSAAYTFRAKTPKYLGRKIAFTQIVKPGETYTLPPTDLIAGDIDNDNQLSVLDYSQIAQCYTYPNKPPHCDKERIDTVDTDDNGVINEFDVNLFIRELSERIGE